MKLIIPNIEQQPVCIEGRWTREKPADWIGVTCSENQVVAVSFLRHEREILWCKSARGRREGQEVRLLLGWYDRVGRDVQVNFGVSGSVRWRTLLPSEHYIPMLPERMEVLTGTIFRFMCVEGTPCIEGWVLFLPASQVKVGRNGLWHLRRNLEEGIDDPIRGILRYGRTGNLLSNMLLGAWQHGK